MGIPATPHAPPPPGAQPGPGWHGPEQWGVPGLRLPVTGHGWGPDPKAGGGAWVWMPGHPGLGTRYLSVLVGREVALGHEGPRLGPSANFVGTESTLGFLEGREGLFAH